MIKEVEGDILLSQSDAIAHGVAPNDDFKQGLALSLREQWPALYKDFRHYCHTGAAEGGELWTWKGAGSYYIVNLFTQKPPIAHGQHPGRADVSFVSESLKNLAKECEAKGFKSLAITRVATGAGGLNWSDVKPLVEKHLGKLSIPVYVYSSFKKGVKALEKS